MTDQPEEQPWESDYSDLDTAARGLVSATEQLDLLRGFIQMRDDVALNGTDSPYYETLKKLSTQQQAQLFGQIAQQVLPGIVAIYKRHPEIRKNFTSEQVPQELVDLLSPVFDSTKPDEEPHQVMVPNGILRLDPVRIQELNFLWCMWADWETTNCLSWKDDFEELPDVVTTVLGNPPTNRDPRKKYDYFHAAGFVYTLHLAEAEITSDRLNGVDPNCPRPRLFMHLANIAEEAGLHLNVGNTSSFPPSPEL